MRAGLFAFLLGVLVGLLSSCASVPRNAHVVTPKRPSLEVTAHPRIAFGPLSVLVKLALRGGDDVEELYCPEVRWDFGDDSPSSRESDCSPWEPSTHIERFYSMWHCFKTVGDHEIRVSLWKADHKMAEGHGTVTILWRAGGGVC